MLTIPFLIFIIFSFFSLSPTKNTQNQETKPQMSQAIKNASIVQARVVRVIDGDTIEVDLGEGNKKIVRYIGINTPETVDTRKKVECFGKEAAAKNKELVENKIVGLEIDISQTDRYGRLLRYVFIDGLFINQLLVREGYAYASSYPPDIKYQDTLQTVQQEAKLENRGLWNACP